jgi:hypothetical protein
LFLIIAILTVPSEDKAQKVQLNWRRVHVCYFLPSLFTCPNWVDYLQIFDHIPQEKTNKPIIDAQVNAILPGQFFSTHILPPSCIRSTDPWGFRNALRADLASTIQGRPHGLMATAIFGWGWRSNALPCISKHFPHLFIGFA